ncbi:MAG: hypothetical protein N2C14_12785, partial [Planctomycetales bacterium]
MALVCAVFLAEGSRFAQAQPIPAVRSPLVGTDLDDSAMFATDRRTMREMAKGLESIQEQRWQDAVMHLGRVLEGPEDFFYRSEAQGSNQGNSYYSLKQKALDEIGRLPLEGRKVFELQYGALAKSLLEKAVQSGDPAELAEVSRRFFHTPAGYEATSRLGMHYLDHALPLAAALCFSRLRGIDAARKRFDPALSLKAAVCLARVGSEKSLADAQRILIEMKEQSGAKTVRVGGKDVAIFEQPEQAVAWLHATLGEYHRQAPPGSEEWVMHRGGPSRNAVSIGGSPLLKYSWRIHVSNDEPKLEPIVKQLRQEFQDQQQSALPSLHPLAVKLDLREASRLTSIHSIRDWPGFLGKLKAAAAEPAPSVARRVWDAISPALRAKLQPWEPAEPVTESFKREFIEELNSLFVRRDFYDPAAWDGMENQRIEAVDFLKRGRDNLSDDEIYRLNRVLLEAAFRQELTMSYTDVVLMRTFDNLLAIDFVTGKRMWEVSQDDEKSQLASLAKAGGTGGAANSVSVSHGLKQRLWNDQSFGTLSSDGKRVFAIEDLALRTNQRNIPGRGVFVMRPGQRTTGSSVKDYNRLAAYGIRTGKLKWEVGGRKGDGELHLAGTFFLGPPLPLAGRLYVLGEAGNEVKLIVLDAVTG